VFPVRYELNSYILFRRNSAFKGLILNILHDNKKKGHVGFVVDEVALGQVFSSTSLSSANSHSTDFSKIINNVFPRLIQ
jgi:hypothetical protein